MPELPEVETIVRSLERHVHGRRIVSVWLGSKPEPFRSSPAEIETALSGSRIVDVRRVGKHIVFDLVRGPGARTKPPGKTRAGHRRRCQWLVHLGMTGQLLISNPDTPLAPHTHAIVHLDDGREIRFVDPRRFGRLSVLDLPNPEHSRTPAAAHSKSGFHGSGYEPLDVSLETLRALFRGRKAPIKSALLNQKLLQGVGNIYADESLFRAGIRPQRRAGRLTRHELDRLHAATQSVLREAIACGGSSISDYVNADGEAGSFQLEHRVYGRGGQPCTICRTPIRRIILAGRSAHYCPHCQH